MQDETIDKRIVDLEKKIKCIEERDYENSDENSVIELLLDMFNFRKLLKTLFSIQRSFYVTDNLISVILFFSLMLFIFWQNDMLHLEMRSAMTTLTVIIAIGFFEFLGANTSIFRGIFIKDAKTKSFLEKIPYMSNFDIEEELINVNFSPKCLDYFIKQLEDKNKYSPEIVYSILNSQALRTQNLNLLFNQRIVKNLHPTLVMRVLYRRENALSVQSIINIYETFKDDMKVLKVLFATQKYSDCLLETNPERTELKNLYKKYQDDKMHLDIWLKSYPYSRMNMIYKKAQFSFLFIFWIALTIVQYKYLGVSLSDEIIVVNLVLSFFIVIVLIIFVLHPFFKLINKKQYNHYMHKVMTA